MPEPPRQGSTSVPRPVEPTETSTAALVQEGWRHLQCQRPLAAWATWQRVLRIDPENPAARKAIETLASASELPAAARAVYRFQNPTDPAVRARWDNRLRNGDLTALDAAASAFSSLTSDHPADADAWYNLALCRAWNGQNREAIASLDRVVSLLGATDADRASDAWTLAEVLRQGAGAEDLADDFRYAWVLDHPADDALFSRWPDLNPLPMPVDPITGAARVENGKVYEWLDRPLGSNPETATDLPRVLATVIRTPSLVRVSSPDPSGLAALDETPIGRFFASARREKSPLPIAWADAALGTYRIPADLDPQTQSSLARSVVEHEYEDVWIHQPRCSLGDLSPLAASRLAARGDLIARVKLSALVRYREQLGARPTHIALYQGYPFDRLRRRLGLLSAEESHALDADDASNMNEAELDRLDPSTLDDRRLADAFLSASAFRDDRRTALFASVLARRPVSARRAIDPALIFAPLVRESLRLGVPDEALGWLETALNDPETSRSRDFTIWRAEIHARTGQPDAAVRLYHALLSTHADDAPLALDAAETLLDNGYPDLALPLLAEAQSRARRLHDLPTLHAAESRLEFARGTDQ